MADFTKLSALVNDQFTVEEVGPYEFKMWDTANKQMLTSVSWQQGYRKVYPVLTDKGKMDLGPGQLGSLLEAVLLNGKADLIGKTFAVKSNGKTGMDIRYFFNPVKTEDKPVEVAGNEVLNDLFPEIQENGENPWHPGS